jgi:hypothetical protein
LTKSGRNDARSDESGLGNGDVARIAVESVGKRGGGLHVWEEEGKLEGESKTGIKWELARPLGTFDASWQAAKPDFSSEGRTYTRALPLKV